MGLLWRLIQNGELTRGSVLFWDEPEANLNPSALGIIAQPLIGLESMGIQIILATHHLLLTREIDYWKKQNTELKFFYFSKDRHDHITCQEKQRFTEFQDDLLHDAYQQLFDRELAKSFSRKKQ